MAPTPSKAKAQDQGPYFGEAAGAEGLRPEIAVIAPYQALADLSSEIIAEKGLSVLVAVGDLEEGREAAKNMAAAGVKIFISRGGTALMLKSLGLPVVEIEVGPCDILDGLKKVRYQGGRVALIGFPNIIRGAWRLAELLEVDLSVAAIESEIDVQRELLSLNGQGVAAVLGDRVVIGQAKALGLPSVLIESGPEAVSSALKEAAERLALLDWAEERDRGRLEALSQFKTVMEALEDPVLIVDSRGQPRVQNPAADRLWGQAGSGSYKNYNWSELTAFKKVLATGLPQVDNLTVLGDQRFLLDFRPIAPADPSGSGFLVAVLGRSAENVEKSERRLRRAVHLKGHVARFRFEDIITRDPSFQRILSRAAEYAETGSAILIQGESGTGKEMMAQSIHNRKFDLLTPFVALNCASLPASILESELFGYVPGAFTGALREGKRGFFELAHGGTLFLDELGAMPLDLQSRLLRVIEERAVMPLGSDRLTPVDVRLIAATNSDLTESVRKGLFRKDLYFRLAVLLITMPPIRDRGSDPLVLFRHMVGLQNPMADKSLIENEEVSRQILDHPWPGNAREIKNVVLRLSITTHGFTSGLKELPALLSEELKASRSMAEPQASWPEAAWPEAAWTGPSPKKPAMAKAELAKALGISRTTLWRRQRRKSS
jgi:transcriptional regulator with PAS, ATPase and Fis domain